MISDIPVGDWEDISPSLWHLNTVFPRNQKSRIIWFHKKIAMSSEASQTDCRDWLWNCICLKTCHRKLNSYTASLKFLSWFSQKLGKTVEDISNTNYLINGLYSDWLWYSSFLSEGSLNPQTWQNFNSWDLSLQLPITNICHRHWHPNPHNKFGIFASESRRCNFSHYFFLGESQKYSSLCTSMNLNETESQRMTYR